ncbi:NUDIX domain-containing protein [Sulfitobacter aestuariivivens]|uniref:NUDIX domain-containing protein n=1 Tax=Sulfitobacter aestuariivivens TaxID=2766981 RepID=A0A927D8C1_9RHOB|nr:NUDIX domain-containing protein [Sulfitobacter aestuariivivens]MBD3664621.1 NUDIX domain-containing protein [Sulfitobacter aestuariivivens]
MTHAVSCPVALHPDGAPQRLPILAHPSDGLHLITGHIRNGERADASAARALFEQSGLETRAALVLGQSDAIVDDEHWHFALCRIAPPVRARWQHPCPDGGGQPHRFEWITLAQARSTLQGPCQRALNWIEAAL